jgi:DNA-directed RNA polymerase subunit RPC12/RpoP
MKVYCNKCDKEFKSMKELNNNEYEELKELGDFVCSDCINEEMEMESN